MNRGKLSRREARARMRFIQEHHYNGEEQRIMDRAVAQMEYFSYVKCYREEKWGFRFAFMAEISTRRLSKAVAKMGASARNAAMAFADFGDKWHGKDGEHGT